MFIKLYGASYPQFTIRVQRRCKNIKFRMKVTQYECNKFTLYNMAAQGENKKT